MKIKKCVKCGGQGFVIQEIIFHEAALSSTEGDLTVFGDGGSGIERIFCKNCDTDYSDNNFHSINFR